MVSSQYRSRRRRRLVGIVGFVCVGVGLLLGVAALAGFFQSDPVRVFAGEGPARRIGVVYVSGDMGLRFGPGPYVSRALAQDGITVLGLNTPTLFRRHRTAAQIDGIVAGAVREALVRTGAQRLVLIGQSFGADILHTGLAHLPPGLRSHVAGVVLIVPGRMVYFRADPTGIAYRGTPDGRAQDTLRQLDWAPLTCIYGRQEADSACPAVSLPDATLIAMPGGHFLRNDHAGLLAHVMGAIRRAAPGAFA